MYENVNIYVYLLDIANMLTRGCQWKDVSWNCSELFCVDEFKICLLNLSSLNYWYLTVDHISFRL